MNLPNDTRLAYIVCQEAWYAKAPGNDRGPELNITASARDGGVAWEFSVKEKVLGRRPVAYLKMFDDAFDAFEQVPEFFRALAKRGHDVTLAEIRSILDSLGAVDETARVRAER